MNHNKGEEIDVAEDSIDNHNLQMNNQDLQVSALREEEDKEVIADQEIVIIEGENIQAKNLIN